MNNLVVGFGEALWDMLPDGKKIGGAPANFAYHVSQFGLHSYAVSAIGDDKLGHELQDNFIQKNLNYSLATVPYATGTVEVELDRNGVPQYDIKENVAWDNIPFDAKLRDMATHTRAICFGSLAQRNIVTRDTLSKFLDAMPKDAGTLKVFDVNLRQNFYTEEILCNSLKCANILKINDEELVIVGRMFGYPELDLKEKSLRLLHDYNLDILILTCGINGSYVITPDNVSFQPTPKVKVADTVGAGDSFTAAFVASMLKGEPVNDAHKRAVAVSAYVCTQAGAMPVLPERLTSCDASF